MAGYNQIIYAFSITSWMNVMANSDRQRPPAEFSVAIIGAGFAGLCMAIRLKQAGIDNFTIFEGAGDLGGTWRDNTYPGCACDIPSHMYSFSFELNADWPRVYSSWQAIQDYLQRCADKYDVRRHIRFDTRIAQLHFDEKSGVWSLTAGSGVTFHANAVASGTGPLNKPSIPDFPGLGKFQGKRFHSAEWDHDYDLSGKTVASIGNGCSAIQYVPKIAPKVAKLYVFQRTPTWIMPRFDRAYTAVERWAFKHLPGWKRLYRYYVYWRNEYYGLGIIGKHPFFTNLLQKLALLHLKSKVKDADLREKLTPTFQIGCKRINIEDHYYPTLQRDNVELVTGGVREITAQGLVGQDGVEREVDAIIFGTGFVTDDYLQPMEIFGRGGRELTATWQQGVETYLGITVAGFPNFFLLLGPNTGLGHNSVVFMIEAQVNYVLDAIKKLRAGSGGAFDVRSKVQHTFHDKVQRELASTTWASGCQSWYLAPDGKNYIIWPGFTPSYWWQTRKFDIAPYELLTCAGGGTPDEDERLAA